MSKRTFRYCKDTGKMVEVINEVRERRTLHFMDDLKPYRVVGPEYGKLITGRSQHREYLRKHNLDEVGNERKYIIGGDEPE